MNALYYGDNLDVLRRHVEDESVDLVYLDPPFNSNANYNVLFAERDGTQAASQIKAFEDTWHWDEVAARAYQEVVESGGAVSQALQAFRALLGENDVMAYLAMMGPRLVALHRALKPTGSMYLHCDSTACHHLKLLLDAIFGPAQYRNQIIWQRTSAHNDPSRYGRVHDVLLFYTKSRKFTWNQQYDPPDDDYFASHDFERDDDGGLYRKRDLTAPAHGGDSGQFEWKGKRPPQGRMWSYTEENMKRLEAEGRIVYTKTGMARLKIVASNLKGVPYQDVWTRPELWLNSAAGERLGYPTQKPEALLERIILASSNEGDTVLDPFCGCGTTIAAAQKLNRRWIGIDITNLAITLIRSRLMDTFAGSAIYEVIGEPVSLPDAANLAANDPYQFQWWALGLVGARPVEEKKGADKGIDGRIYFHVGDGQTRQIILSVKAGHVTVSQVRDLRGVLDREKAEMGVLLSLEDPPGPMRKEASSAGFYDSPWGKHAKLQLVTIEDLLTGKTIDRPPIQTSTTFKRAPKAVPKVHERRPLDFGRPGPDEPF